MPLLFDEVDRIELPDGEWVEIFKKMSYGSRQALTAYYLKVQTRLEEAKKGGGVDIELDTETGNVMLLLLNIAGWNLKDKDGNAAPINRKTVKQLDPDTADIIIAAIGERNPRPKA